MLVVIALNQMLVTIERVEYVFDAPSVVTVVGEIAKDVHGVVGSNGFIPQSDHPCVHVVQVPEWSWLSGDDSVVIEMIV